MNGYNFSRPQAKRTASIGYAATTFVLLALLTGCGGGGGGEEPSVPPVSPPASGPATGPSGVIGARTGCATPVDQSSCDGKVTVTLSAVTNPTLTVGEGDTESVIALSRAGGEVTVPLKGAPGERKLVLRAGDGTVLDGGDGKKTITKRCVDGTTDTTEVKWVADVAKCITVYYYPRTAYVFTDEVFTTEKPDGTSGPIAVGWPQVLRGLTATPLKNGTGLQATGCGGSITKLWNGLPFAACTIPAENNRRAFFPIDVTGGVVLPEYKDPLPPGSEWYTSSYGAFGDSPFTAQGVSSLGNYAEVGGVVYYTPDVNGNQLRRTTDGFATSELIKEGPTVLLFTVHENQKSQSGN